MYWLDVGIERIEVFRLDGLFRRGFIIMNIEKLRLIVFNIGGRYIFDIDYLV